MESLESNACNMTKYGSIFDPDTLVVEAEFNENQSNLDLLEMEREFELNGDSGDTDIPEGQ